MDTSPRKNRVTDDPDMKLLDEKDSKHLDQSILKVVLHFIHKLLDKSYRLWNGNLFFTPLPSKCLPIEVQTLLLEFMIQPGPTSPKVNSDALVAQVNHLQTFTRTVKGRLCF